MTAKRVLYVIATLDPGGSEKQLVELILRLDRREFAPRLCCLTRGGPLEACLTGAGVPVQVLGKREKCDLAAFHRLATLMRRFRPHIVHTFLFTSDAYGCAAAVATGAPVIVSSRRSTDPWKGPLHRMVDRAVGAFCDAVIANSSAVREVCVRGGIAADKVVVIRNGIDLGRFQPRGRSRENWLRIAPGRRAIGFAGRLVPEKGLEYLLQAMERVATEFPEALLLVAGDGELRPSLAHAHRDSEHVGFLGHVEEMDGFYRALDIFVLPSLWEGLPNAVIEAMASGLPVVATDVGGTGELIRDGETGLLVAPRSAEAIAEAVCRLLRSPSERQTMGRAARAFVEREMGMEAMVSQTERLYRTLMARKG